jgi:hypothetical protein
MPEEVIIQHNVYPIDRKGSVYFPHKSHAEDYDIACNNCHHIFESGINIWNEGSPVEPCMACHHPTDNNGRAIKLRLAFHKNCKVCHRNVDRESGTSAPYKTCFSCHSK